MAAPTAASYAPAAIDDVTVTDSSALVGGSTSGSSIGVAPSDAICSSRTIASS